LAAVELTEAVTKALAAPEKQVQQAAAWTLTKLANSSAIGKPGQEAAASHPGERMMLMLIEKVICLKAVDFLAESPEEVLAEIASLLEEKISKAGEIIVAKGETDSAMFLIVDGQVRLHDGARIVATLGENEVFNELMLLNPIPQALTISAVTDTQLLRLTQASLRQVIEEQSTLAWPIMQRLAQRVQRLQGQGRTEQARADLFGGLQEKLTRGQDDRMTG
jgi:CRP/FNR family transcriptional regulator, cyclic AMP receptor protein